MRERPPFLTLTDAAARHIKQVLNARDKPSVGIRIGVKTKGCNGLSYALEYADEALPTDEVIATKDVVVLVDVKATLFLVGSEMDYVSGDIESGFQFKNPNEKGRCGCGESFHV